MQNLSAYIFNNICVFTSLEDAFGERVLPAEPSNPQDLPDAYVEPTKTYAAFGLLGSSLHVPVQAARKQAGRAVLRREAHDAKVSRSTSGSHLSRILGTTSVHLKVRESPAICP